MTKHYVFQDKKVLVIGLGISGFAVAKLLHHLGAYVVVNDAKKFTADDAKVNALLALGIECLGGGHEQVDLTQIDIVVKNPGIPYYQPFIQEILKRKIPIITEPEVAMQVCKAKVIALTATNGKTTTTMMTYQMLKAQFSEVYFAGNVGVAFSEIAMKASKHAYIVLELSSFQLMGMPTFAADVAMILNLDEAHLDYHASKAEYIQAKLNIFKNMQENGLLVLNHDDGELLDKAFAQHPQMDIHYFSLKEKVNGAYLDVDTLYYNDEKVCALSDIVVPGAHNLQNILAAIVAVKHFGVANSNIIKALQTFTGVEHRLEFVMNLQGRRIYNDSKATNVKASQIALSAFQEPIIWIAGGLDRGNDIGGLRPFAEHVKVVVAYGESQEKFIDLAERMHVSAARADNLKEALAIAYDFSDTGDIILLSPASASWDQFKSFEERGSLFKEYAHTLAKNIKSPNEIER